MGRHKITVTAWEDTEAPKEMMHAGTHGGMMRHFFSPDFARGLHQRWERSGSTCGINKWPACRRMIDQKTVEAVYACGAASPPRTVSW
jgi:hypothetical protein